MKNPREILHHLSERIRDLTQALPPYELEYRQFEYQAGFDKERLIETIIANLPVGVAVLEKDTGVIVYMNRELENIYGWSHDELRTAAELFEKTVPDLTDRVEIYTRIADALARGIPDQFRWDDVVILTKSGDKRSLASRNIHFVDLNLTVTVVMDITKRKDMEDALASSERRYREMVDTIPFAVIILDSGMKIQAWNHGAERIFGWTRLEVLEKTAAEFMMPSSSKDETTQRLKSFLSEGDGNEDINQNLCKDGTIITCRWTNKVLRDADGNTTAILSTAEDITQRTQLEEQFRQAQKMEAIGRLAGGIAHDFNNLLTTILGYSEMLGMDETLSSASTECVDGISQSAHRAAQMTQQLLSFSRKQEVELLPVDINRLLHGTASMLRRLIGENIVLQIDLESESCVVKIDESQFEQVIMNLAVNARDAMPNGGVLSISTTREFIDEGNYQTTQVLESGWYVSLTVTDTGEGMDENTVAHLFEPFFTTKGPSEGTGLGLSTAYGIIAQSGGRITVASAPREGAAFTIFLPLQGTDTAPNESAEESSEMREGTESILLVEDEETLIKMFSRILQRLHYRVVEARNGIDALAIIERGEVIDMLVTDVVMPEMGGRELAEKMLDRYPEIPVLFISGYTEDEVFPQAIAEDARHLLVKPFTAGQFADKIRSVLDRFSL